MIQRIIRSVLASGQPKPSSNQDVLLTTRCPLSRYVLIHISCVLLVTAHRNAHVRDHVVYDAHPLEDVDDHRILVVSVRSE